MPTHTRKDGSNLEILASPGSDQYHRISTSGGDVCAKPRRFWRPPARSTAPHPRTRSPSRSRYLPTAAAAAATPRRRCAQPGRVLRHHARFLLGMNFSTTSFSTIAIAGRSRPLCPFVFFLQDRQQAGRAPRDDAARGRVPQDLRELPLPLHRREGPPRPPLACPNITTDA